MDRRGPGRIDDGVDGLRRHRFEVREERRAAVLREIEKRIGDPGLSASTVANLLGITARYVHLLLEETGARFSHHVLDRRLEKAAALLRDPQWRGRLIIEIAAEAGFSDISHFNRAFRRKFRATPSLIRKSSAGDEKG
jgi:AraC-like DNA-binding protein